jgi:hypothetical protein
MFNLGLNNLKNIAWEFSESYQRIKAIRAVHDFDSLKKVSISVRSNTFSEFIKLQTPHQLGVWKKTAFVSVLRPDVSLVVNKVNPFLKLNRSIENNWLLHIEPPGYIEQLGLATKEIVKLFGRVYTTDRKLYEQGGKFIASPPYVHWHLSTSAYSRNNQYDFDFLKSYPGIPEKKVTLAAINSNINALPGHRLRADFITRLCEGNLDFELYGGSRWAAFKQFKGGAAEGKWPVFSPAKYVLAIENEVADYYWTEKFTDAILCFSMPIYHGSPNINQYFPQGSYIPLDITKKSAPDDLRDILASGFYERNIDKLIEARNLILNEHNLFNFIDAQVNKAF